MGNETTDIWGETIIAYGQQSVVIFEVLNFTQ